MKRVALYCRCEWNIPHQTFIRFPGSTWSGSALPTDLGAGPLIDFHLAQLGDAPVNSGLANYTFSNLSASHSTTTVPEPSTLTLLGAGLLAAGWFRKRLKSQRDPE